MRKLHIINTAVLLSLVCFLVSCQPAGGDFVPLPEDHATVEPYLGKKNFVQVYNEESLIPKMYGQWEADGGFYQFLEISNRSKQNIKIDFNKVVFTSTLNKEILFANSIQRKTNDSGWEKIDSNQLIIPSEKSETITITSSIKGLEQRYMPQSFFVGNKVQIEIPLTVGENWQKYKFSFKFDYPQ